MARRIPRNLSGKRLKELIRRLEKHRGLLIAFEGPDGAGKTTQRKLFKTWLQGKGHKVAVSKWNSSELIKPLVKARKSLQALNPLEYCLLHAADFRHRLEHEIMPALCEGKIVIADRFLFNALARDVVRGLDMDWVLKLYTPLLWPDMVFYFSVTPETSGKRILSERAPTYYEAGQDATEIEDPSASYQEFISRVIQEYDALALIFQFLTIDAEQSVYAQHLKIRSLFEKGTRRAWPEFNLEAVEDWLASRPEVMIGW